jgi:4-aminobutyrate aminotransferase-like enzyme/Ser/Thr protein kinase RdoA (MazF antagonist)
VLRTTRPRFDADAAKTILHDIYDIEASDLRELPSERDQNFLVTTAKERLVLKIANASESRDVLELQNEALAHVASRDPELLLPRVRKTPGGETISELSGGNLSRLLSYLDGKPLAEVRPHSPELLRELGRFMGRLDVALAEFTHEGQDRHLYWDSRHAVETIGKGIDLIADEADRRQVADILATYNSDVAPRLESLPTGVIHNDANDHNVLVRDGAIAGLVDFGDMVRSCLVFELANAAAYSMLEKAEPLTVATHVVGGYNEARPLSDDELALVFALIQTRLAMSVSVAAWQTRDEPDEAYLNVSQAAAWKLIAQLAAECPRLAHYRFRDACGHPPHPREHAIVDWIGRHPSSVLPFELDASSVHTLDLSIGSLELGGLDVLDDVGRFTAHVFGTMKAAGATVGVGRYNEPRPLYTSEAFRPKPGESFEPRTLHIGMDLFVPAGTPLRAPLKSIVHSFQNNDAPLDYGPTIILEHVTDDNDRFWTLYGHLSTRSLEGLKIGKAFGQGEVLATVGDYPINGNWPPHLHFQIILDMLDEEGDYPGVVPPSQRSLWLGLCPEPYRLAGLVGQETTAKNATREQSDAIRGQRQEHLSGTLSLSYREPLHIVRGYGSFLYDSEARPYLDMVNNVCHVGHCHPRVVRAAHAQSAVLNTNTRYLHRNIVDYAERLTDKLPEPLEVCFFVNSGSEANDLALRLAHTHTGRRDTVVLDGAYHGNSSSLIDISPYKFDGRGGRGAPPHVHKLAMPDGFRGKFRSSDPGYGSSYVAEARQTLDRLAADGRPIGAFIAESILSCGGQIVLPPHYLRDMYRIVRDAGGVCIADEVQVGFGRVGSHFWAFETQDAVADIVTMGKPIGNGHPLAAVVTTRAIAESFQTGMEYFNTFGGNPVSCAVGLAVLDVIEDEKLQDNAAELGEYLLNGLRVMKRQHPLIGDVRGRGLFLGFELVKDDELTPAPEQATYLVNRMRDEGVLNSTDGPLNNVIKLKPPMVFTKSNADYFLDKLGTVLTEDPLQL